MSEHEVSPTPDAGAAGEGTEMRRGFLSVDDLAAIRRRADVCDDDERRRRGKPPRPTRCRQCATILTLLAHIELTTGAHQC